MPSATRRPTRKAIDAIGAAAAGRGIIDGPGISIKLSALHPRYARAKVDRVMGELYPRLLALAQQARGHDIGLNIDAEEADRLEISLDLLERLAFEPSLTGWNGLGFVIQAYQKRCPAVVDFVVDLARRSGHRLMIRLVKGAYWDSEIKRAQLDGQTDYPVYTRKPYTDVAYIVCARKLLAATDAVFPQFATHNAQTLASVLAIAGDDFEPGQYEFQCLHGMGEPLYEQVVGPVAAGKLGRPCRIYAPVGLHDTLLAYLVRRLLENGANSSFVNRIADENVPLEELAQDPVLTVQAMAERDGAIGLPHPAIPLPRQLYGAVAAEFARHRPGRRDDAGDAGQGLCRRRRPALAGRPAAGADASAGAGADAQPVRNPADPSDVVGQVREATLAEVGLRARRRHAGRRRPGRRCRRPSARRCSKAAADRLEADTLTLLPLLVREAGKTAANAVAEVREAVDFLRYYARRGPARLRQRHAQAAGPGGLHQPVELPAGDLHRPGGRGAGRRQRGAGQAGRADAAGRGGGGARAARGRRAARRAAAAARAAARPSARRWSATRACTACCSPARPRWRGCCSANWPAG